MATISITTDAENTARVLAAFGTYWNLGRDATGAEVKEYLVRQLKAVVRQQERRADENAIVDDPNIVTT
jgi:hypothetical protein